MSFDWSTQITPPKAPTKPVKKEGKKEKKEMSLLDFDDCKLLVPASAVSGLCVCACVCVCVCVQTATDSHRAEASHGNS